MEKRDYIYCNCTFGAFADDKGEVVNFKSAEFLVPSESHHDVTVYGGYRVRKFRVADPKIFKDLPVFSHVNLTFDEYGRVISYEIIETK